MLERKAPIRRFSEACMSSTSRCMRTKCIEVGEVHDQESSFVPDEAHSIFGDCSGASAHFFIVDCCQTVCLPAHESHVIHEVGPSLFDFEDFQRSDKSA
jgi:hypothetical protein